MQKKKRNKTVRRQMEIKKDIVQKTEQQHRWYGHVIQHQDNKLV
jgi:hypothetical protein